MPDTAADLAILESPVYLDATTRSDAVAVRAGRIVGIGADDVRSLIGTKTDVLSGQGLIVPGFIDAHVHPTVAGRNRLNVDLSDLTSRRAYLDRIALYAAANPSLEWIVGGGWAMEHFPAGLPDKSDLDAICPDRPVFLFNRDVHGAWANSETLRRAGITAETVDPPDGRIERDPITREPTGALHEGAAYALEANLVPPPDRAGWEAATLNGQQHLHSLGITGWQDAWVTPDTLQAYRSLAADGRLTARVVGALWWDRHRGLEQITELQAQRELGVGNFHPRTVKIMIDGVLENQTGALLEPYCDGCGGHTDNLGLTYIDADLLDAAMIQLDALGFQVHMHAIGDRAVRMALDGVAAARAVNGVPSAVSEGNRHHIAHLQLIQPEDVPRFAELGVIANCQAYWAQSEPQMDELTIPVIGPDRARLQYPFAQLLRSGARLAMGSDWSVTTANPLEQIEVAHTRIDPDNRSNSAFLPSQRLPLATALDAFTAGSAYVNHADDTGRIALGRRGDLAVLDGDIFSPDYTGQTAEAHVRYTIASGAVVFQA